MGFRPIGVIDWRRYIHRFSSRSRWSFASLESGWEGIKLIAVIISPSNIGDFQGGGAFIKVSANGCI